MIDAVLSYHLNPATCGVAKWNHHLARLLGVPCVVLECGDRYAYPLTSIKAAEIGAQWTRHLPARGVLLLHDRPERIPADRPVLYADELGCPSTITGDATRGRYRVLTFGMAHKRLLHHYRELKQQLDAEHPDYTLAMSTAIHEGTPWDEGLQRSIEDMRAIFGDRLRVLGFLADDALAKELDECDAVAVYFDPAFRANNTTAWAAIAAGKRLFTNRDAQSPTEMPTWTQVVARLTGAARDASTIPAACRETPREFPELGRDPLDEPGGGHANPRL